MPPVVGAIAAERRRLAVTQSELSRRSGVAQANISLIEVGKSDPRLSTLLSLAHALGLELVAVPRKIASSMLAAASEEPEERSFVDELIVPDPSSEADHD